MEILLRSPGGVLYIDYFATDDYQYLFRKAREIARRLGCREVTTSRVIPGQTPNEAYLENGLTSWEDYDHIKQKEAGTHARGEGNDSTAPTASAPTLTRRGRGGAPAFTRVYRSLG